MTAATAPEVAALPLAAVLTVIAGCTAPWARALAGRSSAWTGWPVLCGFGGLAGLFAALTARSPLELTALAALGLGCALLASVDLATHRLPDAILIPTTVLVLLTLTAESARTTHWSSLLTALTALAAAAVVGAGLLLLAFLSPRSLGVGDFKLAALLAVVAGWWGWSTVLHALLAAFAIAAAYAVTLIINRARSSTDQIAFGPPLIIGTLAAILVAAS